MTVTIYGIPCSSTRKAKKWFNANGIEYVERNILKEPITIDELKGILRMTEFGTDEILSTRSRVYRELNLNFDELSLGELLEIIHQNPKILKTPIIQDEKRLQIGYQEDVIRQFIPRKIRKYEMSKWRMNQLKLVEG